jgi:hypothetical protein
MLVGDYPFFPKQGGSLDELIDMINKNPVSFPVDVSLS